MEKYSKEWYKKLTEEGEAKRALWGEKWRKANACPSCGEQKRTVIVGTDYSACPKSLPVAMTSRECVNEGCENFHEGMVR